MLYQNPPYYKRVRLNQKKTVFYFGSLSDYDKFIEESVQKIPRGTNARYAIDGVLNDIDLNIRSYGNKWYGTADKNLVNKVENYLFIKELDGYLQNVRDKTVKVDIVDLDQVKRITFTEQEIGIFSFDLASLGLIPVYEYYSPLLNKIVNSNFVLARKDENNQVFKDANGKTMFYHLFKAEIPKHYVDFMPSKNGYFSDVLGRVVEKEDLILDERLGRFYFPMQPEIPEHDVKQQQVVDENGKKKWVTTWKKSFIHIPKVEKPLPRIDIIVATTYPWSQNASSEIIYNSMAPICLAEKLSNSGINYRIIVCYPFSYIGSSKEMFQFIVAKKEGEALDKNGMSVLLSDGRQIRGKGFLGVAGTQYDDGDDGFIAYDEGYFTPMRDTQKIKDAYIDYLAQSSSQDDRVASKNIKTKLVFAGAISQPEAERQYNEAIKQLQGL